MAGSAAAMRGAQRVEQVARLSQLVQRHFPPVAFAFAYGSGVMHQPGLYTSGSSGDGQPMVDMIFAVEGAREWHKQNMGHNASHYSWVAQAPGSGPDLIVSIAQYIGCGVHFNPLVKLDGTLLKYGVIEAEELRDDLMSWRHLYIAGRLQKPVEVLDTGTLGAMARTLVDAQVVNLRSALTAALLQLPPSFTTEV
uniref:Phosphatidate cytidylyltransferase, mitochondrial n=1 Tax=Chlamydomonas euryale TaxID=1486919 RepID=A0A7R9YWQ8_9CHLO|mmetsp:Transcript_31180/g.93005  ORF Transcript_31180/g.93005 Transcript_31180/m.93005 type:complete len:195 (+) Transcript_31180:257-841(+)